MGGDVPEIKKWNDEWHEAINFWRLVWVRKLLKLLNSIMALDYLKQQTNTDFHKHINDIGKAK